MQVGGGWKGKVGGEAVVVMGAAGNAHAAEKWKVGPAKMKMV